MYPYGGPPVDPQAFIRGVPQPIPPASRSTPQPHVIPPHEIALHSSSPQPPQAVPASDGMDGTINSQLSQEEGVSASLSEMDGASAHGDPEHVDGPISQPIEAQVVPVSFMPPSGVVPPIPYGMAPPHSTPFVGPGSFYPSPHHQLQPHIQRAGGPNILAYNSIPQHMQHFPQQSHSPSASQPPSSLSPTLPNQQVHQQPLLESSAPQASGGSSSLPSAGTSVPYHPIYPGTMLPPPTALQSLPPDMMRTAGQSGMAGVAFFPGPSGPMMYNPYNVNGIYDEEQHSSGNYRGNGSNSRMGSGRGNRGGDGRSGGSSANRTGNINSSGTSNSNNSHNRAGGRVRGNHSGGRGNNSAGNGGRMVGNHVVENPPLPEHQQHPEQQHLEHHQQQQHQQQQNHHNQVSHQQQVMYPPPPSYPQ
jgi:hypothetical protein